MKYSLFSAAKKDLSGDGVGNIFIGSDEFSKINISKCKVALPVRLSDYDEQMKLAEAICDYMNMLEDAKTEFFKNKTIASAVLKRMGNESGS